MIPGLPITISCPHCGYLAYQETVMSRNTIGAKHWSDGKVTAPMYPEFPELVLCKKCSNFYWMRNAYRFDRFSSYEEPEIKQDKIEYLEFPTFYQYFQALDSIHDEHYIRTRIWYSFNDYFRKGKEDLITQEMMEMNNENLLKLLDLTGESYNSDILIKAEILRNLGRFEESSKILRKVTDPDFFEVRDKFLIEIERKNKKLFRVQ